jgi:hypothetical protein
LNMIRRHSPIAHAAYADLLASLKDEAVADLRGTPTRVARNDKVYWYDTFRVGSEVRKTYIGEDSDEIRARLARHGELAARRAEAQAARARTIRILRAEGFLGVDAATGALLNAFAQAGVFRLGGTIVGTQAFRLYEGELGLRYDFDQTAQTRDIDIASFERLSLALDDAASPPLPSILKDFSFEAAPQLQGAEAWRWRQTRGDLLVEFLTPSFDEAEGVRELAALNVRAQALHHLNFLIADPVAAAVPYRRGVLVQIPRPERFAVHKLIVADRRRDGPNSLKAVKDRAQAAFLIEALAEDRPDDLADAYGDATARGPRWSQRLAATLARMPRTREQLKRAGVSLARDDAGRD